MSREQWIELAVIVIVPPLATALFVLLIGLSFKILGLSL